MADMFFEASRVLGFTELQDFQRKAAVAVLDGKDVFVAMPTGSGKSLAFQVLPFVKSEELEEECFVLVISPINSLIWDQMQKLSERGIKCLSLVDQGTTPKDVLSGNYKFLFSSPENVLDKFRSEMKSELLQRRLRCVVVDESHCIVKW